VNLSLGYLQLGAAMVVGTLVGAFLPSALTPLVLSHLLQQPASDEFVQQMAKPIADMKAFQRLAPEASCAREPEAKLQAPAGLLME